MAPTSKPRPASAKNTSPAAPSPATKPAEEKPCPQEQESQAEPISPLAKLSFYLWIGGFSLLTLQLLWNAITGLFR